MHFFLVLKELSYTASGVVGLTLIMLGNSMILSSVNFFSNLTFYTPANFVCGGYTVFTLSVHPCVRASVSNALFLNTLKSHCCIFIKPCKHVYICKTNT